MCRPATPAGLLDDPIGNRTTATEADVETTYTRNNLNQYTAIAKDFPNMPPPGEFVLVNPTYDLDGNLIDDGRFRYEWDCENRLVLVEPIYPTSSDVLVQFDYDYMNRRVRKRTFAWTGLVWSGTAASDTRYVYDEWNLLLELNSGNAVTRKYTWGLDLAGQNGDPSASGLHGAGGIGGLLGCLDTNGTTVTTDDKALTYFYDANGNVGQLIDPASSTPSTPAAKYEYDAYGQTIASAGAFVASNLFRFSTKLLIADTSQYDYGRRFYSPKSGRWLTRDPAGDLTPGGAVGLPYQAAVDSLAYSTRQRYGFLTNRPNDLIDSDGLLYQHSQPSSGPSTSQPEFPAVDKTVDVRKYNCAGLAFRSYDWVNLPETESRLSRMQSTPCDKPCKACEVRCILWKYEIVLRDNHGNVLHRTAKNGKDMTRTPDFHIVCGQSNCANGSEPTGVATKNGGGPLGTCETLSGCRLPDSEEVGTYENRTIFKHRENVKQSCFCSPASAFPVKAAPQTQPQSGGR